MRKLNKGANEKTPAIEMTGVLNENAQTKFNSNVVIIPLPAKYDFQIRAMPFLNGMK